MFGQEVFGETILSGIFGAVSGSWALKTPKRLKSPLGNSLDCVDAPRPRIVNRTNCFKRAEYILSMIIVLFVIGFGVVFLFFPVGYFASDYNRLQLVKLLLSPIFGAVQRQLKKRGDNGNKH